MTTLFDTGAREGTAALSSCGKYRWTLTRQWSDGPTIPWLCFNPSTATATEEDQTVRKCIGFSRKWGYGGLTMLNLLAYRSTDPTVIEALGPSVAEGFGNDHWIIKVASEAPEIICAWGCAQHASWINGRIANVLVLLEHYVPKTKLSCLGYRKDGHPRHPLRLAYDTPREPFVWRGR